MRVLISIMIILLPSCSNNLNANKLKDNYSFSKKMTIIEFKATLGEYAENSPYPNIDE